MKIPMACKKFKSIALLQYCNIFKNWTVLQYCNTFLDTKILQYCNTDFDYWLKDWFVHILTEKSGHKMLLSVLSRRDQAFIVNDDDQCLGTLTSKANVFNYLYIIDYSIK